MSDYKIAICDDEEKDRAYLQNIVKAWAHDNSYSIDVHLFSSAEEFLFENEEDNDFQILLLDIEMGQMDGVTMAKKIRKTNESAQIIFVTGYSDYIAEGYEVAALHYLMKPVNEDKMNEVLDRAVKKLSNDCKNLLVETGGEMRRIPIYKIRFADVRGNYTTIHADTEVTVKKTLSDFEKELDDRFLRVGRSQIVNLTHIVRVTRTDIFFDSGEKLPLPRGYYDKLNKAIIMNL